MNARPRRSGFDVSIDDLTPLLTKCHRDRLSEILCMTPAARRPDVAAAYAGLSTAEWADEAGFGVNTLGRWLRRNNQLPLGAAFRLARIMGVDVFLLFEDWDAS